MGTFTRVPKIGNRKMTASPENDPNERRGIWLGMPYDWRKPSWNRLKARAWNPESHRIFVPKSFGWGYGINFHALWRKITDR
jgi:Family of unknown function (DUF5808)